MLVNCSYMPGSIKVGRHIVEAIPRLLDDFDQRLFAQRPFRLLPRLGAVGPDFESVLQPLLQPLPQQLLLVLPEKGVVDSGVDSGHNHEASVVDADLQHDRVARYHLDGGCRRRRRVVEPK